MNAPTTSLKLAIDVGGTFTDIVLEHYAQRWTTKVLTTPSLPERGIMQGIKEITRISGRALCDVETLVHGTTLATNAIIERAGARTALIGTGGFRDILEIGVESRYDQYQLSVARPAPLVPRLLRFTVGERIDARGCVRLPLERGGVVDLIPRLVNAGVESVAVALMHAYANPIHEEAVRDLLRAALPDLYVSVSSAVCPEIREYERTSTTVANAYVQPKMSGYLERMTTALHDQGFRGSLRLMTSGGGLTSIETALEFPVRLVESGPAGGAIFAARIAELLGEKEVLAFDMGGTTAKVTIIDGYQPQSARSFEVDRVARFMKGSGMPLRIPCIDLVEIGAGGGSLARVDALRKIVVGPESAGSEPGPACYGRGGTRPAVSDANVVLGLIDPDSFAGGSIRLQPELARAALRGAIGEPLGISEEAAAYAVYESVCENMANAARVHAVERGAMARDRTVIAFGGGAPLHVARVAEKIGARRVIIPRNAGVGSAVGFLAAPMSYEAIRTRYMRLDAFDDAGASDLLATLSRELRALVGSAVRDAAIVEKRMAFMRYVGQGHEISVDVALRTLQPADAMSLRAEFEREYARLFKYAVPGAPIEIMAWSVGVSTAAEPIRRIDAIVPQGTAPGNAVRMFDGRLARHVEVMQYHREQLSAGMRVSGPAIIAEAETSTFVTGSFDAWIDAAGSIVMERKDHADV